MFSTNQDRHLHPNQHIEWGGFGGQVEVDKHLMEYLYSNMVAEQIQRMKNTAIFKKILQLSSSCILLVILFHY
jgi:hypothetical protein